MHLNKLQSREPFATEMTNSPSSTINSPSSTINSPSAIKVLYRLHPELLNYTNFVTLMPYLNRYEVLTENERHNLNDEKNTPAVKVNLLLQYLEKKNEETINDFVRALHEANIHTGHKKLCNLLQENGVHIPL